MYFSSAKIINLTQYNNVVAPAREEAAGDIAKRWIPFGEPYHERLVSMLPDDPNGLNQAIFPNPSLTSYPPVFNRAPIPYMVPFPVPSNALNVEKIDREQNSKVIK
jgi:hypothetical protein